MKQAISKKPNSKDLLNKNVSFNAIKDKLPPLIIYTILFIIELIIGFISWQYLITPYQLEIPLKTDGIRIFSYNNVYLLGKLPVLGNGAGKYFLFTCDLFRLSALFVFILAVILEIFKSVSTALTSKAILFGTYTATAVLPLLFSLILHGYFPIGRILFYSLSIALIYCAAYEQINKWVKKYLNKNDSASAYDESSKAAFFKKAEEIDEKIRALKERPSQPVGLTLKLIIGIIAAIGAPVGWFIVAVAPSTLESNGHEGKTVILWTIVGIVLATCLTLLAIFSLSDEALEKQENKKSLARLQSKLDGILTFDIKAVSFYEECNHAIIKGNPIKDTINIIGQKYDFREKNQALFYYKKGEEEQSKKLFSAEYKQYRQNKEFLLQLHKTEQNACKQVCDDKSKIGKEKYLATVNKWLALIASAKTIGNAMDTIARSNKNYQAPQRDWAIAGGIANAIGGAGAGVAVALDTQAKNAKAKENEGNVRKLGKMQSDIAFVANSETNKNESKASTYLKMMNDPLIDENNTIEKFKLLKFSIPSITLTQGQNLHVSFKIECLSKPILLSSPAILDGTLKITIFDKYNNPISTGYYLAPGYGDFNYKNAGFQGLKYAIVTCPIDFPVNIEELRCEIEPENLWLIEKNKDIFKVNNQDITDAYTSFSAFCQKNRVLALGFLH